MDQIPRRLPILKAPGSDPGSSGRLWALLKPSTRMKRLTYAGLGLWFLGLWVEPLAALALPLLLVSAIYYAWRLARLARTRLFWRVRNRILALFVFIGVLPICVVAFIGLIVVWFLVGAMGTLYTEREFESTIDRLNRIVQRVQLEVDDRETGDRADAGSPAGTRALPAEAGMAEAVKRAVRASPDFPGLSISVFELQDNRLSPVPGIGAFEAASPPPTWTLEGGFSGLSLSDTTAHFRAITDIRMGGRFFWVLASAPLNQAYLHAFWRRAGVYLVPTQSKRVQQTPGGVSLEGMRVLKDPVTGRDLMGWKEAFRLDRSLDAGRILLPWGSIFKAVSWADRPMARPFLVKVPAPGVVRAASAGDGAESSPLLLGLSIDPVTVFRHAMSTGFDLADPLLKLLIGLCGVLAAVELVSIVIGVVISRRVTSAVHDLSLGTQAIRAGRFDYRVEERHHDQLGELAGSFNAMAASIQSLLTEVGEKERIEAELRMARDVQAQFFPRRIPRVGRLSLAGTCIPARTVSGDCYDFLMHGDTLLDIVVSDIAGKGMSAALLTASLQSALRLQAAIGTVDAQPGRLARMVGHLNQHLCLNTAPEKYATMFIASYDSGASSLTYCCAGHNPPYLLKGGALSQLSLGGVPVGLIQGVGYQEATVPLETGDLFVIYTDGITEATSQSGEQFGEERLERVITGSDGLSCGEVQVRILETVREFTRGVEQSDDQTLVVGRIV